MFNLEGISNVPLKSGKEKIKLPKPAKHESVKRGCSSAGRAPALQAGGQEFDSPHLHHRAKEAKNLTTDVQSTRACSSGG